MAAKNTVTLTLAGDSDKLEKAFDDVGASAKGMSDKVDKSSRDIEGSFDRAADGFDDVDTKAMGFRDTVTGVQDSVSGFGKLLKGDFSADALVTAGTGVGDLASGFTNLLVPGLKSAWSWLGKTKLGLIAHATWTKTVGLATKVWTGIQAAFNFVMALNPIVLIVLAVIALVVVIVIAYKKSETFRKIVDGAFRWVLKIVKVVWHWIRDNWKLLLAIITGPIGLAVFVISKYWKQIKAGVKAVWGFIKRGFKAVTGWITAPFRAGFQAVRSLWNRWLGGKGFTINIPDWVPVVGGKSYNFRIPKFHTGGVVPGLPGQEMLALLQGGERVSPSGSTGPVNITVQGGGATTAERALATLVLTLIRSGALVLNVREGRVVAGAG